MANFQTWIIRLDLCVVIILLIHAGTLHLFFISDNIVYYFTSAVLQKVSFMSFCMFAVFCCTILPSSEITVNMQ